MAYEDHENVAFLWETPSLVSLLSNDTNANSGVEKVVSEPVAPEEKKRRRGATVKGKGKEGEGPSEHEMHILTERERRKRMRTMFETLHSMIPQLTVKVDKTSIVEEAVNYIKTLQTTLENLQIRKLKRDQVIRTMPSFSFGTSSVPTTSKLTPSSTREAYMANQVSLMNNNINNNYNNVNNNNYVNNVNINNFNHNNISSGPLNIRSWTASNVVLSVCGNVAQYVVYAEKKPILFTNICDVLEKYEMEIFVANISTDEANRSHFIIQARATGDVRDPESVVVENMYRQAAIELIYWTS